MNKKSQYEKGFIDGLTAYSWWKDGKQFIGTSGTELKKALENIREIWNYCISEENNENNNTKNT